MSTTLRGSLVLIVVAGALSAQSFDELSTVRNPQQAYSSLFQVKAGVIGAHASSTDKAVGLDDHLGWDGSLYYHTDTFSGSTGVLDAYAGRDGAYIGARNAHVAGKETMTRLELKARYFAFYREGAYRQHNFVPTGRYEGRDYEAYLGFGRMAAQDLFVEVGPFYRRNSFSSNDDTEPSFTIPDDFNAYGARIFLEHNTVQMDRQAGVPRQGFVLTLVGEQEWNDSAKLWGADTGAGPSFEMPSAVRRAHGRMEWYVPQSDATTWQIFVDGSLSSRRDRVYNYDAQRPQGSLWLDGQLRLRWQLGDHASLAPFFNLQYVHIESESGAGTDTKTFIGAGAEGWLHFSDTVSLNAWYSYLDNESRPPVSSSRDLHGQHMFFAGMVLRFGAMRR